MSEKETNPKEWLAGLATKNQQGVPIVPLNIATEAIEMEEKKKNILATEKEKIKEELRAEFKEQLSKIQLTQTGSSIDEKRIECALVALSTLNKPVSVQQANFFYFGFFHGIKAIATNEVAWNPNVDFSRESELLTSRLNLKGLLEKTEEKRTLLQKIWG